MIWNNVIVICPIGEQLTVFEIEIMRKHYSKKQVVLEETFNSDKTISLTDNLILAFDVPRAPDYWTNLGKVVPLRDALIASAPLKNATNE